MSRRLMRFALGHGGHNAGHDSGDLAAADESHSEHSPESNSEHPAAATGSESETTNPGSSGHYQALEPTLRTQSVYARLADE